MKQIIRAIIYYPALLFFIIAGFLVEMCASLYYLVAHLEIDFEREFFKEIIRYLHPKIYIKYIKTGSGE